MPIAPSEIKKMKAIFWKSVNVTQSISCFYGYFIVKYG